MGSLNHRKHPLEDDKSWDLHQGRSLKVVQKKKETEDDTPYIIVHKKPKKHIPFAGGDTTHGMMIDAGSQGTRLHIYEWDKRFLLDEDDLLAVSHGKKLSIPTSNSRWTDKYTPGLDVFTYHKNPDKFINALRDYLNPLLDFARNVLKEKESEWATYPIYLKATGGVRTLPQSERIRLIEAVRALFHDESFNPFSFEDERCRVISGEEEAIYGWVGVNFAKGTLIDSSLGNGDAVASSVRRKRQLTYGMLEMGGASTQIANYENNGDLMANLFKLQLGGARHWNIYVHSYLYFGINGAWTRLNARLHSEGTNQNPCLPIGTDINFESWVNSDGDGKFYDRSDLRSQPYSVTLENNQASFDYDACSNRTYALLRKEENKNWCDFEMDGNCGFAGIYQPPFPTVNSDIDEFVATSNFVDVYNFLQLGDKAAVSDIGLAAQRVCALNWQELQDYHLNLGFRKKDLLSDETLAQMCFRSVFVYHLLRNGWGFGDEYEMTAVDVINGQKMGWALGCMLYEINTLPWDFHPELLYRGPSWYLITLYIILGILTGSIVGFALAMKLSKKFNKRVRESAFFHDLSPSIVNNSLIRKSLAFDLYDFDALSDFSEGEESDDEKVALTSSADGAKYH